MCTPWLVINGKQAFVYLLTLCVLEHFVLSHYFWEAFSYCEPWHFLNLKKGFLFSFFFHALLVLEPLLCMCIPKGMANLFQKCDVSPHHAALWAAADRGRSLWPVLFNVVFCCFFSCLIHRIYGFVLPTEAKLITTLLLRTNRIFCTDPLPRRSPVDRTAHAG